MDPRVGALALTTAIKGVMREQNMSVKEISVALMQALATIRVETKASGTSKAQTISTQAQAENIGPGSWHARNATGLYLNVGETGSRSWVVRFWHGGKRREMGLGSLKEVSLAEAAKKARAALTERDEGRDPIESRKRNRAANLAVARAKKPMVFRDATETLRKALAKTWKHARADQDWFNPIARYAYPVIGDMPLNDIKVEHVLTIMGAAVDNDAPAMARKVRVRIGQVLNGAIARGERDTARGNPADAKLIAAASPQGRKAKPEPYRRIALDDAPAAFQRLVELAQDDTAFAAWAFMIATAARPSEALNAKRSEIDFAKKLWTIPGGFDGRMKEAETHVVPLSSVTLTILELQAKRSSGDAIFAGASGGPLSYSAFGAAPARAKPRLDAGSPHSWRSIFRDACGDILRVDRDLAEAALAHKLNAVESAYRRGTAIEARRPAMEEYARWLTSADAAAGVVPFRSRA
jgi:integrase